VGWETSRAVSFRYLQLTDLALEIFQMFLQLARKAPAQVWSAQALLLPGLPLEGLGFLHLLEGVLFSACENDTPQGPEFGQGWPADVTHLVTSSRWLR
jgi:hypothetical protein